MSTSCSHPTAGYLSRSEGEFDYNDYQIIKAIQPKTSWDIEIINDKLKLK